MKTFKEFILEAEFIRTVNPNQVFHVNRDKKTQENLNNARRMGPGRGSAKIIPVNFSLVPAKIPMR